MRRYLLLGILSATITACGRGPKEPTPEAPKPFNAYDTGHTGGGAVQSVRGAVARTVTGNDLHNLHIFIESASSASGNVPDKQTIIDSLKTSPDAKNIVSLIEDGSIILTGIRQREGIWAYEKKAPTEGGNVISNGGVKRMTAFEVTEQLKKQ